MAFDWFASKESDSGRIDVFYGDGGDPHDAHWPHGHVVLDPDGDTAYHRDPYGTVHEDGPNVRR